MAPRFWRMGDGPLPLPSRSRGCGSCLQKLAEQQRDDEIKPERRIAHELQIKIRRRAVVCSHCNKYKRRSVTILNFLPSPPGAAAVKSSTSTR